MKLYFYSFSTVGALIITGGLTLHLCVAAMLIFKPIKRKDQVPTNENTLKNGISVSKGKIKYSQSESKHLSTFQQMKTLTQQQNYIFIFLNMFLIYAGFYLACTHIVAYAEYHGASSFTAGVMASTLGFCNLAGRLGLSVLSQHPEINTIYLHSISTLILGNINLRGHLGVPDTVSGLLIVPLNYLVILHWIHPKAYRFKGITSTCLQKLYASTGIGIVHLGPPDVPLSNMKKNLFATAFTMFNDIQTKVNKNV